MDEITVPRDGTLPLRFAGEELSYASSEAPGKDRWFELTIYRTDDGRYVAHGTGVSDVVGEDDRHWATVCATPGELIDALRRDGDDGVRYLPKTSQRALEDAALEDDRLSQAYATAI